MSEPFQVPQELIDLIIDRVAGMEEGAFRSLITCSLVSKSFRYRCTKHLFSSIRLSYLRYSDTRQDSPLQQYPTIAQYIEHLILSVSSHIDKCIQESSLPSVTETVSPLRLFTLIGDSDIDVSLLDWGPVSIALERRRQMSNPLLSSQLTTLCLKNVRNVPPTLFSKCINLTSIVFENVDLQPSFSHTQATLSEVSRPRLLSLKLVYFSRKNLLERLFPPLGPPLVDLSGLRSLTIIPGANCETEDLVAVRELMAISKDTLHSLSWYHWQPPPPAVDRLLFPALRVLEIPIVVKALHESCDICFALVTISNSPTTLEMLTTLINFDDEENDTDGEDDMDSEDDMDGEDNDTDDDDADDDDTDGDVGEDDTDDDDTASEESEDDTSHVPQIQLKYPGLKLRKLVSVMVLVRLDGPEFTRHPMQLLGPKPLLRFFTRTKRKASFHLGKIYFCFGKGVSQN